MDAPLAAEILEQHGRFVRALAGALVHDPWSADDLAQETLTRWLARPPLDPGRERGWLATVLRRLASNARRAEWRRALHQERAAQSGDVRTPLEQNEQPELVQHVVANVMALDPVERDTILARYFRGLTAAELARESLTSENTVRSRERRALESLRKRLDREHVSRKDWALGLLRLAQRDGLSASLSVAGRSLVAAASVATVVLLVLFARGALGKDPASSARAPALAPSASTTPTTVSSAMGAGPRESVRMPAKGVASEALVPGASPGLANATLQGNELATVRCRLRLSDGSSAAGVPWQLTGAPANLERLQRYGRPADWVDPSGTTAADGSFEIAFSPPGAFQFLLDVKAPIHAAAAWRWSEILPGTVLELGLIDLELGARVQGRLVDGQGAPILGEQWTIDLQPVGALGKWRSPVFLGAAVNPLDGSFLLEDAPPGLGQLAARSKLAGWMPGQRVTAVAGQTVEADFVYAGPSNARRITVRVSSRPFNVVTMALPAEHVHLVAPNGERRTAQSIPRTTQTYSFEDLAPGLYTLEIDDPRVLAWSQSGIAPGTAVEACLEPSAAVQLAVTGADGQALDRYTLSVEFQTLPSFPREFAVSDGSAPLAGGIVRLPPGDFLLHLKSGTLATTATVPGLVAGETRAVTVSFAEHSTVSGHVLGTSGLPLAGVELLLLEPAQVDDSDASPVLAPRTSTGDPERFRLQLAACASGADGTFELPVAGEGTYLVRAGAPGRPIAFSPIFELEQGASRSDVELVLPPAATISGTVRAPDGTPCTGLSIWIGLPEGPGAVPGEPQRLREGVALDAEGRYSIGDRGPGSLQARLYLPTDAIPGTSLRCTAFDSISLGTLTVAPGADVTHDFDLAFVPGSLSVQVLVHGAPAPGVRLKLVTPLENGPQVSFDVRCDPRGSFATLQLFPGTWEIGAVDPELGWSTPRTPVAVPSGGSATLVIPVELSTGTLRFLDADGQALVGRRFFVSPENFLGGPGNQNRPPTDGEGRASFTLTEGNYDFQLEGAAPGQQSAIVHWTSQGPEVEEVRF